MDEHEAVIYFRRGDVLYRVKAFEQTVWIERQLIGNTPYARADHPVYDGLIWNFDAIDVLVRLYETEAQIDVQRAASATKLSRCLRVRRTRP